MERWQRMQLIMMGGILSREMRPEHCETIKIRSDLRWNGAGTSAS
jgi:hypothetical protein